jgi:hypothetical protein
MRLIELNAVGWKSKEDFYDAILAALGAPSSHGRNADALVDSMAHGGINSVEPPYKICITGTKSLPVDVAERINWMVTDVSKLQGREPEIVFQIDP